MLQTSVFTEEGCERIMRVAFDLARTRRRKKVTSVTKSNAQQYGMVLFYFGAVGWPTVPDHVSLWGLRGMKRSPCQLVYTQRWGEMCRDGPGVARRSSVEE